MPSMDVHFSSNNMNLCTPPEVLEAVRRMGPIGLDPATNPNNPVGAGEFYVGGVNDGLSLPWVDVVPRSDDGEHGLVFCNPPYGRQIGRWTAKAALETRLARHKSILLLVPARTDTAWFQDSGCDAWCAWRGRLHFIDPETGEPVKSWSKKHEKWLPTCAPFPSAILYYGHHDDYFRFVFSDYGRTYERSY